MYHKQMYETSLWGSLEENDLTIRLNINSQNEESDFMTSAANRDWYNPKWTEFGAIKKWIEESPTLAQIKLKNVDFDREGFFSSREYDQVWISFYYEIPEQFELTTLPKILNQVKHGYAAMLDLLYKDSSVSEYPEFKTKAIQSLFTDDRMSGRTLPDEDDDGFSYEDNYFSLSGKKEEDPCKVLEIKDYNPPALKDAKTIKANSVEYTFEEKDKIFTIRYDKENRVAKVMRIECVDKKASRCKVFINDGDEQYIKGLWTPNRIEIKMVYMGKAKGSGHCTKAVGYMLKVLLREAAKEHEFPEWGRVYIESEYPCAAVNCYSHAFMINGFVPSKSEIDRFKNKSVRKNGSLSFTFYNFYSKSQAQKRKDAEKKAKESIADRVKQRRKTVQLKF